MTKSYQEIYHQYQTVMDLVFKTSSIIFDEALVGEVTVKGVADFVTKVDIGIESFLKQHLQKEFPNTAFISEEQKENVYDKEGSSFILDPIDGTTNLIHHYQHSAVSLALCEQNEIVFGIVYNPFTAETFVAARGKGAYLNEKPIKVSECRQIEKALITFGTAPYNKELAAVNFPMFERIFQQCADIRISGSAALDICYIASGRLEAYAERNLKPWDFAAASLILTEAGGKITDWNYEFVPFDRNTKVLATNQLLHEKIGELIRA